MMRATRRFSSSSIATRRAFSSSSIATRRAFSSSSIVTTEITDGVATITLNAPERLNAMTVEMGEAFEAAVGELRDLPPTELRAAILTGAGRAFSAGGDLDWLLERHRDSPTNNAKIMRDFYGRFLSLRTLEVPIVAAINGPAIGAGFAVACACDLRVAAPDAKVGITFVGLGLPPGMGSTHWLPSIVGPQRANELILTGEVVDGAEAARRGLVLCVAEDPVVEATALAATIAAKAPLAVRAAVRAARLVQEEGLEAALRREADSQAAAYGSADLAEGVAALKERRAPAFAGV